MLLKLTAAVPYQSKLPPFNLRIRAGEHYLITGPRASGKTLLAQTIAGRRRLTAGRREYPFLEASTDFEARREAIRLVTFMDNSRLATGPNHVHYYQQRFNAFDADGHPTVRQYLAAGGQLPDEDLDLLAILGVTELLDLEKIKLSSGQTRKVLLARELLGRPHLLVIDNPYVGLDVGSRQVLNDLLDTLAEKLGVALVLSGHVTEAPSCIHQELHLPGDGMLHQRKWTGRRNSHLPTRIKQEPLLFLKENWQRRTTITAQEIINFKDVTVGYGERTLLENLTWKVMRGDKWVVIGPNGSGKSTLLSLIYADNPQAYAHDISLFGIRRGRGSSIWEIKRRIGFTSPELHTYFREQISAREVLLTGFSDTFTLPGRVSAAQDKIVDALLAYFELTEVRDALFPQLSTGTQRLILLCRALVKAPPVLLLDEPFQGLDATDIYRARHLLDTVLEPEDTLLFISHFAEEVPGRVEFRLEL